MGTVGYVTTRSEAVGDRDSTPGPVGLEVLKTLGDNTRYAIYLELARSPRPLTTAEIAATLQLHPNTVRPHLERMRDLDLVEVTTAPTGAVGRPQHRYSIGEEAPSLGLEPPAFPLLTRVLLESAANAGIAAEDLTEAGRDQGAAGQRAADPSLCCADALVADLTDLGFDPARVDEGDSTTVAFTHCPFRELAEAHPVLVCSVHRGMVEGFVDGYEGASVNAFHSLVDHTPCRVTIEVSRS